MGCKVLCLSVIAFMCLMKVEHVRAQCTRPHFGENVVLSDGNSLTGFPNGSTVTFVCVPGYKPINSKASRSVTCSGNQWTDLALECTRRSCGSLPDFSHGRYEIPNGILFGETITAVCNKGYMLSVRRSQRVCRAEGVWDGRDPVCEVVKCPPPPKVENGQLDDVPLESYEYLHSVSYKCNSGFSIIGNSALHCDENGTFQPEPPKCFGGCIKNTIPHSVRIAGGLPPYHLKKFLQYKCEDGYKMEGDSYIVCTENGWDPEPPKCIAVKCPPPPIVENGQLNAVPLESYEYLQNVSYKCNSGFLLIGKSTLRCSKDENFQPEPPKCVYVCSKPEIPHAIEISKQLPPYQLDTLLQFKCEDGYKMEGTDNIKCKENGWTPEPPNCIALPTPTPTLPPPNHVFAIVASVLVGIGCFFAGAVCYYKKRNSKHYSETLPTGDEEEEL
ncbi:membrane cofactor protein-like isoform X3 [Xyrauchen texanus]|uniref:membrane cofactor protein-like isoform X3 n=1 Tax=Xyrauchen texanus TaxID=154827 RepID=UPI002242B077|nr:membrane cofactor protein-like isoform X3 [Xyrauchen texanus]